MYLNKAVNKFLEFATKSNITTVVMVKYLTDIVTVL